MHSACLINNMYPEIIQTISAYLKPPGTCTL
jgi:hypothetical protein